ncbi:FMN-binding glutamate synthase family protein [Oxalicibacterium faecigallinarum]|uniref:FMN-binding glutamate synthase family protein n=1 Tax=Oxalicibacterium faecigallinarum TaxID=573741 RepID=A0A8J3AWW6_9BURK|nr:FMN-binding glutamate synthase family protein [Oxalicibacterium faecigallinarum]GGI21295.1 FMN-binding glutamate synthase family protein [Oxalicibacterium faecigallinarum]
MRFLPIRYVAMAIAVVLFVASLASVLLFNSGWWLLLASGALTLLGIMDMRQKNHALLRNYPILAHFRYLFESVRPEIRQYFLEEDAAAHPFSRNQRSLVYQRAKQDIDKRPFGTQYDVYQSDYEWINHSIQPSKVGSHDFRITIGGDRAQPYSASVFNISAMSFGSLSANAIRALNQGAQIGRFMHDTGEGSISRYHRPEQSGEPGGDLVWEIGSGYFGCRDEKGNFSPEQFTRNATLSQVKMIEIKLSQGAKPGHGGMLPGAKVTKEIAEARGIPEGIDCISPSSHSAFDSPIGLLQFVEQLRTLSGGKPTGFKLAIGHPWEFFGIVKAMMETGITPDFIVIDGGEGGTGAAPVEFTDHVGMPLQEALLLVHNTLVGAKLRDKIKLGASGKIVSAFDIVRTIALGADWCNSARGFMFALGCIQSQSCHTDRCPTGIATQDTLRQRALVVPDKAQRVANFHQNTLKALAELIAAAGLTHPSDLKPHHLVRRVSANQVKLASALLPYLEPGQLLSEAEAGSTSTLPEVFARYWPIAQAHSFNPLN